ncbi:MAG: hypothetical protein PVF65_08490 [Sphingomonadales bacterium]|jgi:hypothetical protein
MIDQELKELQAAWQSETYQSDVDVLKNDLKRSIASERMRNVFEIASAIVGAIAVIWFVAAYWSVQTIVMGMILLVLMSWAIWYRFRIQSRVSNEITGSVKDLTALALQRSQLRLRELRLGLSLLFISTVLGTVFGLALKNSKTTTVSEIVGLSLFNSNLFVVVAGILFIGLIAWLLLQIRREKLKSEGYKKLAQEFSEKN